MDSIINSIQIIIFNVCACKLSIANSLGERTSPEPIKRKIILKLPRHGALELFNIYKSEPSTPFLGLI